MNPQAHFSHPRPTMSRRMWLCGVCAATGSGAMAGLAVPAFADDHSQEQSIGQQVYNDLRSKNQIVDQSVYYPILRRVGQRISTAAAPHWYTMNFVVVKGAQANAFSVPGGWVYVNEALLKQADNEDELANVLGHETGHIVLGHVMNRIHQAQTANIIGTILGIFIRNQGTATLVNLAGNYAFLNFSRQQEYQADHEGVILASKAAYNPYGMIWFFRKLQKLYGNAGFEQYVQDHPSSTDRISRIQSFFASDPTQFGQWHDQMPTSGLSLESNGDTPNLVLSQ